MLRKQLLKYAVKLAQWHNRTFHRHDPPRYLITGHRTTVSVGGVPYPVEFSQAPPLGEVWYAVSGSIVARGKTYVAAETALKEKLSAQA